MPAPKGPRPISRALLIIQSTEYDANEGGYFLAPKDRAELIRILIRADASTGKPDSARKHKAKKNARR